MTLRGKKVLILGASSGVGRATLESLTSDGAQIVAVARGARGLASLSAGAAESLQTIQADAADPSTAKRLLAEHRPDCVVLAAGAKPHMAPLTEQTWQTFSEPWNADAQAAFHLLQAALTTPLAPGSTVVVVSSGAAIDGSPLSGGYAGAKRMQWLLVRYAQQLSDRKRLGLRFLAVLPHQLIEGSAIGANAAEAYGAWRGTSAAALMQAYTAPLDAHGVASVIGRCLRGELEPGVTAVKLTGQSVETLG